jgi:uncharacterized membrane protein
MVKYIVLYAVALAIFFAMDLTWLGLIAKNLYKDKLGFIMSDKINWAAAIIFYLLFIGGMMYFAIIPGIESGSLVTTLIKGALLGGLCYATYDLTNMATIANWPISIVVIDIVWGMVLTATCSVGTYLVAQKFFPG